MTTNARSDALLSNKLWVSLIHSKRCLIPVQGYFEWINGIGNDKIPYYFSSKQNELLWLAGLYQDSVNENGNF